VTRDRWLTTTAGVILAALLSLIILGCCGVAFGIFDAGSASIPTQQRSE
jgi:hypothetical protein